jgi:hypothetical protein
MGHTKEAHSLPYGHDAKAAEDIDGLVVSCDAHRFTHSLNTTQAPRGPLEVSPHGRL